MLFKKEEEKITNSTQIKEILDKSNISTKDEMLIMTYIYELEDKVKRLDKVEKYIEDYKHEYYYDLVDKKEVLNILRGEDNE